MSTTTKPAAEDMFPGLFSWTYLHKLGTEKDTLWQTYLDELAEKGLKRDPR
mgnify:CR=1 FL=1